VSTRAAAALGVALCIVAVAFASAFSLTDAGDYANPFCAGHRCGDAAPAIDALQRGRVARFFDEQPAMGPVSLVVRAPAARIARASGGGESGQYRAGSIICLLAAAVLGLFVALRLAGRGVSWMGWLPVALLCVVNPASGNALELGHPEEVLGAALLAGGALAAGARPTLAAVLVGLAIATKQWALVGVIPISFLAPGRRRLRLVGIALAVAALLTLPMAAGDFGEFRHATRAALNPPGSVKPIDIWFPFAHRETVVNVSRDGSRDVSDAWLMNHTLDRATHWIVIAVSIALIALWWRRAPHALTAAWLLALLLLVRVLGDARGHPYHLAPFLLALFVAEAIAARGYPWRGLAASAAMALTLQLFDSGHWRAANIVFLAWSLPAAVLLTRHALRLRTRA